MRSCATFASGANSGTKMNAVKPSWAANPASDEAALPVEAQHTVWNPSCLAFTAATEEARSLNEPVGFRPSSLIHSSRRP